MTVGSNLLRYNEKQIYLVFDTETESLNLYAARPWQVAWLLFCGNEILERGNHMIRWDDLEMSADSAKISHFDPKAYAAGAEDAKEVLARLETHLLNPEVRAVGHNLTFDGYMHRNWRRGVGLTDDWSWYPRHIDTLALGKALHLNWTPGADYEAWQLRANGHWDTSLKGKLKLGDLAEHLGVEYRADRAHDAAYDVEVNMLTFKRLLWAVEV